MFQNLRWNSEMNEVPSQTFHQMLWFPEILFCSSTNNVITKIDEKSKTFIMRQGHGFLSDETDPYETRYYEGSKHPIITTRRYN